jgi:hypothetical protein
MIESLLYRFGVKHKQLGLSQIFSIKSRCVESFAPYFPRNLLSERREQKYVGSCFPVTQHERCLRQKGLFHVLAHKLFVVTSMDYVYEIWNFT